MTEKPKIVVVTNLYPNVREPTRGIFIAQLVARLKRNSHITVIAPLPWRPRASSIHKIPKKEIIDGVEVLHPRHLVIPKVMRSSYAIFMWLSIFPLLRRLQKAGRCDLISAHWVYPDGVASAISARILNVPFYVHALGCDINEYSRFFLRRMQIVFALKAADKVVAKSIALASSIEKLGIEKEKIEIIPNGVDGSRFRPGNKETARHILNIPGDALCILYVGNFNPEKNVKLLITAFSHVVLGRDSPTRLYLVGDGPERDDLQTLVEAQGISDQVFFLGRQPNERLPDYYRAADYFALPSLREGCPNVILEALSCGLPVIASNVGGIPDIVKDKTSILVEPDDLEGWCRALKSVLDGQRQRASEFCWPTWEQNAAAIEKIFAKEGL